VNEIVTRSVWGTASLTLVVIIAALAVVVNRRAQEPPPKGLDLNDLVQRAHWEASE
jgi:hypothetical protein